MMIVIINLWAQCTCIVHGGRKLLTSKFFLLFFIEKRAHDADKDRYNIILDQ